MPNQNWLFQMCVIAIVSATFFNVQISPTFCEQYIQDFRLLRFILAGLTSLKKNHTIFNVSKV